MFSNEREQRSFEILTNEIEPRSGNNLRRAKISFFPLSKKNFSTCKNDPSALYPSDSYFSTRAGQLLYCPTYLILA